MVPSPGIVKLLVTFRATWYRLTIAKQRIALACQARELGAGDHCILQELELARDVRV